MAENEQVQSTEQADTVEQPVQETANAEEVEQVQEAEKVEVVEEKETDIVADAAEENKRLKQQLEDIKNDDSNVLEQNEALKAELEQQQQLAKIAGENAELKAQLEGIKRKSITDNLIKSGGLTNDLKEWADGLTYEQLQTYAANAPKRKNILQQTNDTVSTSQIAEEFLKVQNKGRIM